MVLSRVLSPALGRQLFPGVLGLVLWCAVMSPCGAQTNGAGSARRPQRYLFIVETSRTMKPRARGVFETLKGLLDSGIKGQLHRGDTLGIWTFNETVYTGWLPSQEWSSQMQMTLGVREAGFLQSGAYEKSANLDKAVEEMQQVIRGSGLATVILITSGENEMRGTPFDQQINAACKRWHDEQQKTMMPLVTVLRARNGIISQWSVTPAPWPVEMPPLPVDTRIAETKPSEPTGPGGRLQFSTTPLVVFAKEAGSNVTSRSSAPAVSEPKPQPAVAPAAPPKAEPLTDRSPAAPEKDISPEAKTPPASTAETSHAPAPTGSPNESSSARAAEMESPQPTPTASQLQPPPAAAASPVQESPPKTQTLFASAEEKAPATAPPRQQAAQTKRITETSTPPAVQAQAEPRPVGSEKPKPESTTAALLQTETQPASFADPVTPRVAESAPVQAGPTAPQPREIKSAAPAKELPAAVQTAVATPEGGFLRQNWMWLGLLLLAGAGAGLCFLMWVRTYSRPQVDLLTLPDSRYGNDLPPNAPSAEAAAGDDDAGAAEETTAGGGASSETASR